MRSTEQNDHGQKKSHSPITGITVTVIVGVTKQDRKHGYLSRVQLGKSSNEFLQASKHQNTRSKLDVTNQPTNGPTNQPTNQPM